jgi:WD40 repeat protein
MLKYDVRNKTIVLDTKTGRQTMMIKRGASLQKSHAFPTLNRLCTIRLDGIIIFNLSTGDRIADQGLPKDTIHVTTYSTGFLYVTGAEGRLGSIDLRTLEMKEFNAVALYSAVVSPDGQSLVVGFHNRMCVFDFKTTEMVSETPVDGYVTDLTYLGDRLVYSVAKSRKGTVIYMVYADGVSKSIHRMDTLYRIRTSPDGVHVCLIGKFDEPTSHHHSMLVVLNTRTGSKGSTESHSVYDAVFSLDGSTIATTDFMGTVELRNTETLELESTPIDEAPHPVTSLEFIPE